jgi:hypothetical protein
VKRFREYGQVRMPPSVLPHNFMYYSNRIPD